MQDFYLMSWKELFLQPLLESDEEKLAELIQTTEQAMAVRAQKLSGFATQQERNEMAVAKVSLLSIKSCKLGWPSIPMPRSLRWHDAY